MSDYFDFTEETKRINDYLNKVQVELHLPEEAIKKKKPWKGELEFSEYATFYPDPSKNFKYNMSGTKSKPEQTDIKAKISYTDKSRNSNYFAKQGLPKLETGLPGGFEVGITHYPYRKKKLQPKPYSEMRYGGMIPKFKPFKT